jgi:hypothetical protein
MSLVVSLIASNIGSYSDEEFSRFMTNIASEGIFNTNSGNDFKVTESSPQAMSVDIDTGQVLVSYLKSGVTWKVLAKNSASVTKTINPNTSGTNRVDAVIVHLKQDEPNATKNNVAEILVVDGSGAVALTDGAIDTSVGDTNWYRLANITVEDSETVIQNSDIADTRSFLTLSKFKQITTDIIAESTSGGGVTVDDWNLKENAQYVQEKGSAPATPSTGYWAFYFKSDGMYVIDDAGASFRVQIGGISTTQKAEAAAANGEVFENTDDGNRLSWKESGGTVNDVFTEFQAGTYTKVLNATANFDQAITTKGAARAIEIQISANSIVNDFAGYVSGIFGVWSTVVFEGSTFKYDKRFLSDSNANVTFGSGLGINPLSTLNTYGATPAANGHQFVLSLQSYGATGFTIRLANTKTGSPANSSVWVTYKIWT